MPWVLKILVGLLLWNSSAQASLFTKDNNSQKNTSDLITHLQTYYPDLKLTVSCKEKKGLQVWYERIFHELRLLEAHLGNRIELPVGSLQTIACNRAVCGGGDGGSCRTCYLPSN